MNISNALTPLFNKLPKGKAFIFLLFILGTVLLIASNTTCNNNKFSYPSENITLSIAAIGILFIFIGLRLLKMSKTSITLIILLGLAFGGEIINHQTKVRMGELLKTELEIDDAQSRITSLNRKKKELERNNNSLKKNIINIERKQDSLEKNLPISQKYYDTRLNIFKEKLSQVKYQLKYLEIEKEKVTNNVNNSYEKLDSLRRLEYDDNYTTARGLRAKVIRATNRIKDGSEINIITKITGVLTPNTIVYIKAYDLEYSRYIQVLGCRYESTQYYTRGEKSLYTFTLMNPNEKPFKKNLRYELYIKGRETPLSCSIL